tara:strand:+ start:1873 stop:2202 length:330 start_codon:yes stop_codon:yes gene_type:complete
MSDYIPIDGELFTHNELRALELTVEVTAVNADLLSHALNINSDDATEIMHYLILTGLVGWSAHDDRSTIVPVKAAQSWYLNNMLTVRFHCDMDRALYDAEVMAKHGGQA